MRLVLLLALLLCAPLTARAQFEKRLIADEHWSAFVGANDLLTIQEALVAGQNEYLPHRFSDESTVASKLGGLTYRVARTVLLENIIDNLIFLTQHEVFGHGARYREFGDDDVSYSIQLVPPYGDGAGWTRSSGSYYIGDDSEDLIASLAGSQANAVLASEQRYRLFSAGVMNHRQSNMYLAGMLDLTHYVLRTNVARYSSNDIANSVYQIYGDRAQERLTTLKKQILLNFVDPMQWYSAYNLLVNNFWFGNDEMSIPMIELAEDWKYLPNVRVGLTPYGTEYFLENYAIHRGSVFGLVLAMDELKEPSRISLNARYVSITDWLGFDTQLQIWRQPRFRGTTDKLSGVLFSMTPSLNLWSNDGRVTSLVVQFGFKSKGFIEGENIDVGPIFRAGLSFF